MKYPEFEGLNFKNYLRNLGSCWDGFTTLDLIKEFIDNGLDWKSTKIKLISSNKYIIYTDNGEGMNEKNLFRLAEFYSTNNQTLGNGKFGIGGNKAQVALSDLDDTWHNKKIKIVSKINSGEVRSLEIKWFLCDSLDDYVNQVKSSYRINDKEDLDIMEDRVSGTFIKIYTSESRVQEIKKFMTDLNVLIDLSITYGDYIEKGREIYIGDKKIISYLPNENIINDTIKIKYFKCGTGVAYSAKINQINGSNVKELEWALKPHGNGMSSSLKQELIPSAFEERAEIILRLKFNIDIYKPCSRGKGKIFTKDYPIEFENFIEELSGNIYAETDLRDKYLDYVNKLYVKRESSINIKRTLGFLNINPKDGGDFWKQTLFRHIGKSIEFSQMVDRELKLVQANKSKVEWDKTPCKLDRMIQLCIIKFRDDVLCPKFNKIDKDERKKSEINITLEDHLILKLKQKEAVLKLEQFYLNYLELKKKYPPNLRLLINYYIREKIEIPAAKKIQSYWRKHNLLKETNIKNKTDAVRIIESAFINYMDNKNNLKNKKFKAKLPEVKIKIKLYLSKINDISTFTEYYNKILKLPKDLKLEL
jgi:hypothetical protein